MMCPYMGMGTCVCMCAGTPAVWAQRNSSGFNIDSVVIFVTQDDVSNALKVESTGFTVRNTTMHQTGTCDDKITFYGAVTFYMHMATYGVVANNTIFWQCSAFDMDVSASIVFEDNTLVCTNAGVLPHGNSVSGYDWRTRPVSQFWSLSRNSFDRPPFTHGTWQNWVQRETLTTDGSGAYGTGVVVSMAPGDPTALNAPTKVVLQWSSWSSAPLIGTRLVVMAGGGMGQYRSIIAVDASNNGTVYLDRPLDAHVVVAGGPDEPSVVAVLSSFGAKAIVGNRFNWTEVVQWYGNTILGIMADNTLTNCNVKPGGNIGSASVGAVGECYHGLDPVLYTVCSPQPLHMAGTSANTTVWHTDGCSDECVCMPCEYMYHDVTGCASWREQLP